MHPSIVHHLKDCCFLVLNCVHAYTVSREGSVICAQMDEQQCGASRLWLDPAVLLNLTCYMTGALAHLASLRQPLAAIWVSLSAQSSRAPRIAEVLGFPSPPSLNLYPLPSSAQHPRISIFFFCCHPFTHHGPEAFSAPRDGSLETETP